MVLFLLAACSRGSDGTALLAAASAGDPVSGTGRFEEIAEEVGLRVSHPLDPVERYAMPAIMAGGLAVLDVENDGDLDLYVVAAGERFPDGSENRLFLQGEDGTFRDATAGSGLGDRGYGMGAAVADIDNDGDVDLFVSNYGQDSLYRNDGNGTFTDVTREALGETSGWSTSACFLDLDRDGWLDLFVARYVEYDAERVCRDESGEPDFCGPTTFPGVHDLLYRNEVGTRFRDVSLEAGIARIEAAGLGVACADLDGDGLIDIYVANDADPNHLWLNQGDGTFRDDAILLGAAYNRHGLSEAGMGVAAGDVDLDGRIDLFVTHLIEESNTLYRNLGERGFEDATAALKLEVPSLDRTGFGTALFDADNDGDLDLAIANGAVKRRPRPLAATGSPLDDYVEPNQLFEDLDEDLSVNGFADACNGGGDFCRDLEVSRALVPADFDRDGDLDLLVSQLGGPVRLFCNRGGDGETGNWLELRLLLPELARDALGATVRARVGDRTIVRPVTTTTGYLSASPATVHLGLGRAEGVDELIVRWPDGGRERFPGMAANRAVELRRGEGEAVP